MTGAMLKQLRKALLKAFDRKSLKVFVREEMDLEFDEIVEPGDYRSQVFNFLAWLGRRNRLEELITKVLAARPNSRNFQETVAALGLATAQFSSPWNVPHRRNQYFTGREDVIEELHKALHNEGSTALGQAINGLGGIGKTQTAVEYCHRYRDLYKAVLWTRAETEGELRQGLAEIARVLDLPQKEAPDKELVPAVLRWLGLNDSWLLVLDNADTPELLVPYLPDSARGHILVTSRAPNLDVLEIAPLRLEVMSASEALLFLRRRVWREDLSSDEEKAAQELAEELGYLPLALEQASAYISLHDSRFSAYLKSYRRRRVQLLSRGPLRNYREPVASTWSLNFEQVSSANEAAAEVLRLTACLGPDQIPDELLIQGARVLGSVLSEALAEAEDDELVLDELLHPLARYSLIERDRENRTFSVHRMVREVVRLDLDKTEFRRIAERIVEALTFAYPGSEFEKWPFCDRLLPHWREAATLIGNLKLESKAASLVLNQAGVYLKEQALLEEAASLLERSLKIGELVLGAEHPDVATSLNNLASLHYARGDYAQAAPLYERSLKIREKVLGVEHPDVATSLNNLASFHYDQGDYAQAEFLFERSLKIREKVFGAEHPSVALSLNNLANLHHAQGDSAQAAPLLARSLKIRESVLGAEHPDVADSLNDLASLHQDQGDYTQAAPLYERSLKIREQAFGAEHPDVAVSLNNLASLHQDQGDYAQAAPLFERSLKIWEKVLGAEHPDVARSLNNLALLHKVQGDYAQAATLYERSLKILEKMFDDKHPHVRTVRRNLASLLELTGKADPVDDD